jgi:hypothetical protein
LAFKKGVAVLGGVALSSVEVLFVTDEIPARRRTLLQAARVNVNFTISFEELSRATSTVVALDAAVAGGGLQMQLVTEGLTALTDITLLQVPSVTLRSLPPSPPAVPRASPVQSPQNAPLALNRSMSILVSVCALVVSVACSLSLRRRARRGRLVQCVEAPPLPIVV